MNPGSSDKQANKYSNKNLFDISPQPSWIYDIETLQFLEVNEAAVLHYGYSREEFLQMTLKDIRPPDDILILEQALEVVRTERPSHSRKSYRHLKKNGEIIDVQIQSNRYSFYGLNAEIVLVNDVISQRTRISLVRCRKDSFLTFLRPTDMADG